MNVPDKSNFKWRDIVTGKKTYNLKFLAAKIALGRIVPSISASGSPEAISDAVEQMYTLYQKNIKIPSVQEDIKTIFG